ncbi:MULTISPECIES: hypothetical protein [Paenarthrobacter]|jgi:predicted RecB family nuclease|uniref:RecB family nuclease n=1 Tax=Paenarthrobacter nicotinovorans TaxID=29320 RepID=A0ABT9TRA2_PAENI|nr:MULTISPECIES: hypothetical protein [Paenarthrobacter]KIA73531.1 hypothetical protein ANMWB30_17860 [Arthrobacter sp. MWB30]KQQ98087.1 hypothetical protein ASF74_15305 [Arthrobacter sp. Leaf145]SKB57860.1 hypothetical protein SAMN05660916_01622 [Arthrobacter sp. 31Cvi3.1E]BCW10438.1 hypothetical protein NtRootA2_17200 [Arthrobacter sp. NtRootA2]BCW14519.1 hypothetical protein NtRootA4_14980 [Arthrobacter sp. NtRootA4]BCW22854.1 hypothetical protein NtRootC7_17210 [Arthrobacter sp. NtRootC7]
MSSKSNWPGHTPLPKGLAAPAKRALAHQGIETLEQLAEYGEGQVSKLHGMGPVAIAQLEDAMEESGITYGTAGG